MGAASGGNVTEPQCYYKKIPVFFFKTIDTSQFVVLLWSIFITLNFFQLYNILWGENLLNFSFFAISDSTFSYASLSPIVNCCQDEPLLLTEVFPILKVCAQVGKMCKHMYGFITSEEIVLGR